MIRAWLLLGLAALAMPASAQLVGSYRPRVAVRPVRSDPDLGQIRQSIDDGRDGGQLTKRQARALRRETDRTANIESRTPEHLSDAERAQFEGQHQALREQVAAERSKKK